METIASYAINIRTFDVPNSVGVLPPVPSVPWMPTDNTYPPQTPALPEPTVVPLSHLSPEVLDHLCELFTRDVFTVAGKAQPIKEAKAEPAAVAPYGPRLRQPMNDQQIQKLVRELSASHGSAPSSLEHIVRLVEKFHGVDGGDW